MYGQSTKQAKVDYLHATVRGCEVAAAHAKSAFARMQLEAAAQAAEVGFLRMALSTAESIAKQTSADNAVRRSNPGGVMPIRGQGDWCVC